MNDINLNTDNQTLKPNPSDSQVSAALSFEPPDPPLRLRTKLLFAIVTALGGLLIGSSEETSSLAIIVVFFSVIGFVFVDRQKLFALPPMVAYTAMLIAAVYSVADFVPLDGPVNDKMAAVAQLLAVAQAILMLQEKKHRLLEQLMIFAMLNCVVAAVFNDALNYGIWFVPLAIASGIALAFYAADTTVQHAEDLNQSNDQNAAPVMDWSNTSARQALSSAGLRLPWTTVLVLFPATAIFAGLFFFALPRTIEASRGGTAAPLVGFSDSLNMLKIGQMQQSTQVAMRVSAMAPNTEMPYPISGGIYLRGRVLENYSVTHSEGGAIAEWASIHLDAEQIRSLPPEFVPDRETDQNFYDSVEVKVACESLRSPTLFAIAPYHGIAGSGAVAERFGQATFVRKGNTQEHDFSQHPRLTYRFGTHAFRDGVQGEWLAQANLDPQPDRGNTTNETLPGSTDGDVFDGNEPVPAYLMSGQELDYLDATLAYEENSIFAAARIAESIIEGLPADQRDPVSIARAFERFLSLTGDFTYTLNLNDPPVPGMDPIQQFLTVDRRGHCQFFAAALAMMLRSQQIPARLVVGYHCDEFNELGEYYMVRQSHAHAWVEALINRNDLPRGVNTYGQPKASRYWLRLEPTPGGGGVAAAEQTGSKVLDLAKNLWDDYVIEMDPDRQKKALLSTPGLAPMTQSYRSWIDRVKDFATRINAGEVQGIGNSNLFSFSTALLTMGICLLGVVLLRFRFPQWLRFNKDSAEQVARPSLRFYAEALDLLARQGVHRRAGQTPAELANHLKNSTDETHLGFAQPISDLTGVFYRMRYGADQPDRPVSTGEAPLIQRALAALRQQIEARKRTS